MQIYINVQRSQAYSIFCQGKYDAEFFLVALESIPDNALLKGKTYSSWGYNNVIPGNPVSVLMT